MRRDRVIEEFSVVDAQGRRARVIAVPDPARAHLPGDELKIVYGIGGLIVEKISESQFRDFSGALWTIDHP